MNFNKKRKDISILLPSDTTILYPKLPCRLFSCISHLFHDVWSKAFCSWNQMVAPIQFYLHKLPLVVVQYRMWYILHSAREHVKFKDTEHGNWYSFSSPNRVPTGGFRNICIHEILKLFSLWVSIKSCNGFMSYFNSTLFYWFLYIKHFNNHSSGKIQHWIAHNSSKNQHAIQGIKAKT